VGVLGVVTVVEECLSYLLDDGGAIHGVVFAEALRLFEEAVGNVNWVIFAEIAIEVMQFIQFESPHFVLLVVRFLYLIYLLFDDLVSDVHILLLNVFYLALYLNLRAARQLAITLIFTV
jgi:hypothetical protein